MDAARTPRIDPIDEAPARALPVAADAELTSAEVAARHGVSRRTVTRHCVRGRLPATRSDDGHWRIAAPDAAAWAARRAQEASSSEAPREAAALVLDADRLDVGSGVQWLVARHGGGHVVVALGGPCEALGLSLAAEVASLRGRPWAQLRTCSLSLDGAEVLDGVPVVERRTLTMWLATIEPARVAPAARGLLVRLQRECDAMLDTWLVSTAAPAANDDAEAPARRVVEPVASATEPVADADEDDDAQTEVLARLERLEQRLGQLVGWVAEREAERQAAFEQIDDDETDPEPVKRWRHRVNRALQGYCQLSQVSHRLAWREAYVRLYYHCGVDAARRQRMRGSRTTIEVLTEQELRWLHDIVTQMAREWQRASLARTRESGVRESG